MSRLCRWFGHQMPRGYAGGTPYLRCTAAEQDGLGRWHAYLTGQFRRCNMIVQFAAVHLPFDPFKRTRCQTPKPSAATPAESPSTST